MKKPAQARSKVAFALCIDDKDCDDIQKGKVYRIRTDADAKKEGYLRVVDESGEDYLYPESYFIFLDLPPKAKNALLVAS